MTIERPKLTQTEILPRQGHYEIVLTIDGQAVVSSIIPRVTPAININSLSLYDEITKKALAKGVLVAAIEEGSGICRIQVNPKASEVEIFEYTRPPKPLNFPGEGDGRNKTDGYVEHRIPDFLKGNPQFLVGDITKPPPYFEIRGITPKGDQFSAEVKYILI